MAIDDTSRDELGAFLKARRAAVTPEQARLPGTGQRRVKGLRREEVADLAFISADYYRRLEQGRTAASATVLNSLAEALHLDEDERTYLSELSGKDSSRHRHRPAQKVSILLRRLLNQLTDVPALVLGRRMDVLAWNPLAAALLVDFASLPARDRNYVRLTFTHPAMRALYPHWEQVGRLCVAQLHMEIGRDPHDPRLNELVDELSRVDADFRRWWNDHKVAVRSSGVKDFRHPVVGDLTLDWDTLTSASDPDQQLVTLSAKPGTTSHQRLHTLADMATSPGNGSVL